VGVAADAPTDLRAASRETGDVLYAGCRGGTVVEDIGWSFP
jgi:hypothetical protein